MTSAPPPFDPAYVMREPYCVASIYDRFWEKVDIRAVDDCWPWSRYLSTAGYGRFGAGHVLGGPNIWVAPRVAYTLTFGPIPATTELDHVCHTADTSCVQGAACPHRACVNPWHLEPVTHHENALRREVRRTHFRCGHPYEGNRVKNGGSGRCAICHREHMRAARSAPNAA